MTFLVVLAGSVVRMTGSGMGCPDWPKCFGLLIPPTDAGAVTWRAGEVYTQGRMLVARDTLWVAQSEILASDFESEREDGAWLPYDRHDYAVFNPVHTWVEFINRLLGALTGIPAMVLLGWTLFRAVRHRSWPPFVWAVVHLFWLGLVAWLGKKVVDGNLIPFSITLHMLGALAILISLLGLLRSVSGTLRTQALPMVAASKSWLRVALFFAVIQLVIGTQVREQIDALNHAGILRSDWLGNLPDWWKWHRSGSWVVLILQLAWIWPLWRYLPSRSFGELGMAPRMALMLVVAQMLSGIVFVWAGMPAYLQPLHLLLAVGLILTNVWAWMHHRMVA